MSKHGSSVRPVGRVASVWVLMLLVVGMASATMAQGWSEWVGAADNLISFRAKFEDGHITVEFVLAPDPDSSDGSSHKTYALDNEKRGGIGADTVIAVEGGLAVTGAWTSSDVLDLTAHDLPDFGFKDKGWFKAPAKVTTGGSASVIVAGMVCSAIRCEPAHKAVIDLAIAAGGGSQAPPKVDAPPASTTSGGTSVTLPGGTSVKLPDVRIADGLQPLGLSPDANTKPTEVRIVDIPSAWSAPIHAPSAEESRVRYRARLEGTAESPILVVEAEHDEGWHTYAFDNKERKGYSDNTAITVSGALQATGEWTPKVAPKTVELAPYMAKKFGGTPEDYAGEYEKAPYDHMFEGTVTFSIPVKIVDGDAATLSITGQVCEDACFNYADRLLTIAVRSSFDPGAIQKADDGPPKPKARPALPKGGGLYQNPDNPKEWRLSEFGGAADGSSLTGGDSWWGFVVACILGGLVALLMPCVYPMIPITLSFFGKQAEQRGGSTLGLGLMYAFGVVFSYTVLGSALTAIFGASGVTDFAGSAWVASAIALLFFIFALSMFGMFELRLPYSIQQKFNVQGNASSGMLGSFVLGTTFAVTSMACTVPVVGSIFTLAADGQVLKPMVGMIVFSAVVAIPFVILAVIPGALKKMPRAGGWMNNIKVIFAFIELAAAAEFLGLARIIDRSWVLAIWVACFMLCGIYLLGLFRAKHDAPVQGIGAIRMVFASLFIGVAMWFSTGLYGGNLGFIESFLISEMGWEKNVDLRPKLEAAKTARQPVFLDFTGSNCANCRLFEKQALDQPWGKAALEKYAKFALYTDSDPHGGTYLDMTRKLFGYTGQPAYVVLNADGQITAWLADIRTVLQADSPQATFEEFVATANGPGYDWSFDGGFFPPAR